MASCAMRVVSVMAPRGGGAQEASRASTRARSGRSACGRPYPSPVVTLRTLRAAPQPRANAGGNRAAPSRLRAVGANAAEAEERLDTEEEFGEVDEWEAELPFTAEQQKEFLSQYWQKRPLLVRGAAPSVVTSPVEADELAGLACEDGGDVRARLILERGGKQPWELRYGPFTDDDFESLPESHYALLVEGADRLVPEVADVLDLFAFLPRWRVDDVMISYCSPLGSVGPHSDNYDVFLLQAGGPKRWAISSDPKYDPDNEDAHEQGPMVRVLKDWAPEAQRLVRPGDMLYLPPRVAHHGVATAPGQTLSIGALAPRHEDLLISYVETLSAEADAMMNSPRWTDPDLTLQANVGEINGEALGRAEAVLEGLLQDRVHRAKWFGAHVTEPVGGPDPTPLNPEMDWREFVQTINEIGEARMLESVRAAYVDGATLADPEAGPDAAEPPSLLFVSGQCAELKGDQAVAVGHALANRRKIRPLDLKEAKVSTKAAKDEDSAVGKAQELVLSLMNQGMLYFQAREGEQQGQESEREGEGGESSEMGQAEPEGSYQVIDLAEDELDEELDEEDGQVSSP